MPAEFAGISKDLYTSALWNYPILFFLLKKALSFNIYNEMIVNLVKTWSLYVCSSIPFYNINKLYLALSLEYINKAINSPSIYQYVQTLLYSIDFEELQKEIDPKIMNINEGWFFVAFLLKEAENTFKEYTIRDVFVRNRKKIINKYLELYNGYVDGSSNKIAANLIHGISGVIVMKVLYPEVFE